MYNELFHIGPFTVYGYGLMIGIGIIAAYLTAEYRAKKSGLDPERILGFVASCAVGGFIGAKLLYIISIFDQVIEDISILWPIKNGWVVYGGIIFGIGGAALYCKIKKLNILKYLDNAFPSVALGQAFGRIGCFLAGCCYGKESHGPLAVTFTHSMFAPNNVPLIPTQLISSALDFLNFAVLAIFYKKNKKPGRVLCAYLIFYSIGRFIIEYFRGDLDRGNVGVLSTSQFIAIFTLIAGVVGFILATVYKKKTVEAEDNGEEKETTAE